MHTERNKQEKCVLYWAVTMKRLHYDTDIMHNQPTLAFLFRICLIFSLLI